VSAARVEHVPGIGPQVRTEVPAEVVQAFVDAGWWGTSTLAETVAGHAARTPDRAAFIGSDGARMSWREYHDASDEVAATLVAHGIARGERVAVMMPDGPLVHLAYMALEKAGIVIVGIGPRAGRREIAHILRTTGAVAVVTQPQHFDTPAASLLEGLGEEVPTLREHLLLDASWQPITVQLRRDGNGDGAPLRTPDDAERAALLDGRHLGANTLFLINSTSGTTGLPKCVMHFQNRWTYFHRMVDDAAHFSAGDVFMSVIPAPFGFGIWTAHVTPTLCGATTVLLPRFRTEEAIEVMVRERVTVFAAVSTQFIMMLNSPNFGRERGALRCMFTGGEMVPYARAREFEERTGARVLQVFGSNETGALSRTTVRDSVDVRLRTAGQVLPEMNVRLLDEDGGDVTARGGPGEPVCRGPATCLGYYADEGASRRLFTDDGWMRTGDVAVVDGDGVLTIVGRRSDIIIRGGQNISAGELEAECQHHPAIAMVAVLGVPDPLYGEKVCACVVLREGAELDLDGLRDFLAERGNSRHICPEHLVVLPELPYASGGKVAKAELRTSVVAQLGLEGR
jgi:acyl-CoA synthetase